MIDKIILNLYFCFSCYFGCSQSADWKSLAFLPEELDECSGMVYYPPNRIVHINDGGNKPALIVTDTIGNIIQDYCVPGAENNDWEDLCKDDKGNLYIGDFGNNRNAREDLKIYKIPMDKVFTGEDDYSLKVIGFQYEDQVKFPPKKKQRKFDNEAMIHIGDSIYLFTKNRTRPFNGYTYCYKLPDLPGYYIAEKVDSFFTGNGPMEVDWITGASFRENPRTLVLLGYNKMWMFYYFEGRKFFSGKHNVLYFNTFTQKEALTFKNNNTIFISDEHNTSKDGMLYELKLPDVFEEPISAEIASSDSSKATIESLIVDTEIELKFNLDKDCEFQWQAFSAEGQRMHFQTPTEIKKEILGLKIGLEKWNSGIYDLHVLLNDELYVFKIEKIESRP